MYSTCIFCASDLGANDSIEAFPVGSRLAFDAWKGRLWAICPRCARWNLAPLEDRWEAVEQAEKRFRDSRLRVHSENVGLARLPDGSRLIRVGEALPGELAAWRYGAEISRRRRKYMLGAAGAVLLPVVAAGGVMAVGAVSAAGGATQAVSQGLMYWQSRRIVDRVPADRSPTGERLVLRRYQLNSARLGTDEEGQISLLLPKALPDAEEPLVLTGAAARSALGRVMATVNRKGAREMELTTALNLIARAGGPDGLLRDMAGVGKALGLPRVVDYRRAAALRNPLPAAGTTWRAIVRSFRGEVVPYKKLSAADVGFAGAPIGERLPPTQALALEMALHEESERRALAGEFVALEAAWREAEEIAAIADVLPEDPLRLLLHRGRRENAHS